MKRAFAIGARAAICTTAFSTFAATPVVAQDGVIAIACKSADEDCSECARKFIINPASTTVAMEVAYDIGDEFSPTRSGKLNKLTSSSIEVEESSQWSMSTYKINRNTGEMEIEYINGAGMGHEYMTCAKAPVPRKF